MIEIKDFYCEDVPSIPDLYDGMTIARTYQCAVRLSWSVQYSGAYSITITENSTLEDCQKQMPTCYPV